MFGRFGSPMTSNGLFKFKDCFMAWTSSLLAVAVKATTGTCEKLAHKTANWE